MQIVSQIQNVTNTNYLSWENRYTTSEICGETMDSSRSHYNFNILKFVVIHYF